MEFLTALLMKWGFMGLMVAAFTESFISPILPDVFLIPLALAHPHNAIYYGAMATLASVVGGFIGYWIGRKWGMPVVHKIMPDKYAHKIQEFAESENVSWAIFLAAMSPIPYKCVSISAGAFEVKWSVFIVASVLGRAKRFFLEAVLIYYFGEAAVRFFHERSQEMLLWSLALVAALGAVFYFYKRAKRRRLGAE